MSKERIEFIEQETVTPSSIQPSEKTITSDYNSSILPRVFYKEEQEESTPRVEYKYLDKNIKPALVCPICRDPFIDPITVQCCGQTFCSKCIVGKVDKCPNCRKEINVQNLQLNRNIGALVDELKVECSMCNGIVERGQLKDHQAKYCPLHEAYQQVEEFKKKLEERLHKDFKLKEEKLQLSVLEFENQVLKREKLEMSNKPIHLNVGGTIMTLSLGMFIHNEREPENLFKKMFTGEYPCYQTPSKLFEEPVYYIDCDLLIFKYILEWLEYGKDSIGSNLNVSSILMACKKFSLDNLALKLSKSEFYFLISQVEFFTMKNNSQYLYMKGFDMRNLMLEGLSLDSSSITKCCFRGMDLRRVNFTYSNLSGCNFSESNLEDSHFQECNLTGCNLLLSSLKSVNFSHVNLSKAKIQTVRNSNFAYCNFTSSSIEGDFDNLTLKNCQFTKLSLKGRTFHNIDFSHTKFKDTKFKDCIFISCNFSFTDWKNSTILRCNFEECNTTQITVSDIHVENCSGEVVGQFHSQVIANTSVWKDSVCLGWPRTFKLIYRGSVHGFSAESFHSKCDDQGPTFTIIKSDSDNVFGGYTSKNWLSISKKEERDNFAFLFKIENGKFTKFNIKPDRIDYAIYNRSERLVCFGGGHDISIDSNGDCNHNSYADFGNTFELPSGMTRGDASKRYLAGSDNFKVSEIEVFTLGWVVNM